MLLQTSVPCRPGYACMWAGRWQERSWHGLLHRCCNTVPHCMPSLQGIETNFKMTLLWQAQADIAVLLHSCCHSLSRVTMLVGCCMEGEGQLIRPCQAEGAALRPQQPPGCSAGALSPRTKPVKLEQKPEALLSACRAEEAEAFEVELGKHPKLLASYQDLQETKEEARAARQLRVGSHSKRAKRGGSRLAPTNAGGACSQASMCLLWCMCSGAGCPCTVLRSCCGPCLSLGAIQLTDAPHVVVGGPRQRCAVLVSGRCLH